MEEVAFYDFEANDISISQEENIDYEELEPIKEQIILDQLQSEQGGRFLRKRNRNIIIKIE